MYTGNRCIGVTEANPLTLLEKKKDKAIPVTGRDGP
jgi:hypothetical protein